MSKVAPAASLSLIAAGFLAVSACELKPMMPNGGTSGSGSSNGSSSGGNNGSGTGGSNGSGTGGSNKGGSGGSNGPGSGGSNGPGSGGSNGPGTGGSSGSGTGGDDGSGGSGSPMSCGDMTYSDKYSPGYTPDQKLLDQVKTTLAGMSSADKLTQMRGTSFGTTASKQFGDIQRSMDTASIRGFRYRDASRGVNMNADLDGSKQSPGYSTVFPVSMARGASFDPELEYQIGEAIGDEMQAAKLAVLLAPCMNLLRHPLWGRAQETYSEDPHHLGKMASAFTVGVQQHVISCAKHYAANNIEVNRAQQNAMMDEQTLHEIYGRHFEMVVQEGGVGGIMASYNKVNGVKATQNAELLTTMLRTNFGFRGFVLSDWWAMPNDQNASADPNVLKMTATEAIKAGLDIELPWNMNFSQLENQVGVSGSGLTQADIDKSVSRILEQKLRFGLDNKNGGGLKAPVSTWSGGAFGNIQTHVDLAEKAAIESMVLLKNDKNTLPIASSVKKVAVLGATVSFLTTDGGTTMMNGTINFATGVRTGDLGSSRAFYDPALVKGKDDPFDGIKTVAGSGVTVVSGTSASAASDADFIVVVAGLTAQDEGEEYTQAGDRTSFALDAKQSGAAMTAQNDLITAAAALNKPMVVVLEGGSVIDLPWLSKVPAVVMAWYPGEVGGQALGKLLFGKNNFGGKLPFTWPAKVSDLPTFNAGGTTVMDYYVGYRYFDKMSVTPQFPFGYGLSYSTFEYKKVELGCSDMTKNAVLPVNVTLANTGTVDGDETVMVFVSYPGTSARRPTKELKGFLRVSLKAGEEKTVKIPVRAADLKYWMGDAGGKWVVESGDVKVQVGPNASTLPLSATVTVK